MHESSNTAPSRDLNAEERWEEQVAHLSSRITEPTLHLLMQAREEAKRFDHLAVSTEHLLLALLRESDSGGALVLRQLGTDLLRVHDHLFMRLGPLGGRVRAGEAGLTPLAMGAIQLGWEEALRLGHDRAGSEHLLLGLWREGDGGAGQVLAALPITLEQARLHVMQLRGEHAPALASSAGAARDATVTCALEPHDLAAIDTLIAAGGATTRSDAVRWLVHEGIAAHASLFDSATRTMADIQRLRDSMQARTHEVTDTAQETPPPTTPMGEQA